MRFSAKFHLQMCAVLSQANNHKEALKHAQTAASICEDNILKTFQLKERVKSNYNNENKINTEEKIDECFKVIDHLKSSIMKVKSNSYKQSKHITEKEIDIFINNSDLKISLRNILGVKKADDWVNFLNIGNIMYLSAINSEDLDLDSEPNFELLRDAVVEKVVMLTVSYFCLATEIRFLNEEIKLSTPLSKKNNEYSPTFSEFHHSQAVEFSCLYLPSTCPIVKHYISSYYKHYGNNLQVIPENEIINTNIELIKTDDEDPMLFIRSVPVFYNTNINEKENKKEEEDVPKKIKELPKFHLDLKNINEKIPVDETTQQIERCNSLRNILNYKDNNTTRKPMKKDEIIICKNIIERKPKTDRINVKENINNLYKIKLKTAEVKETIQTTTTRDKNFNTLNNFMKIKINTNPSSNVSSSSKLPYAGSQTTRAGEVKKNNIVKNNASIKNISTSPIKNFLQSKLTPRGESNFKNSRTLNSPENQNIGVRKIEILNPNKVVKIKSNKIPNLIEVKNTLTTNGGVTPLQKYNTNFSLLNQKYGDFLNSNFTFIRKFNQSIQRKLQGLEYSTADNSSTLSKTKNKIILNQPVDSVRENTIQNTDESSGGGVKKYLIECNKGGKKSIQQVIIFC